MKAITSDTEVMLILEKLDLLVYWSTPSLLGVEQFFKSQVLKLR